MGTEFSSGVELAEFVVASDLLRRSWEAIDKLHKNPWSSNITSSPIKCETVQHPNYEILAFACSSSSFTARQQQQQPPPLKQRKSYLPINKAARALYRSLPDDLFDQLENSSKPLIVTGNSLGGLVASHVALEFLQRFSASSKNSNKQLPLSASSKKINKQLPLSASSENNKKQLLLCITFGSPIVGGNGPQQVINDDQPTWNSRFLHVVSDEDHIPRLFLPSHKPFGTYLICSTSGCACFSSPDSVLGLLEAKRRSDHHQLDSANILGHLEEFNIKRHEKYGEILRQLTESNIYSKGFNSQLPRFSLSSHLEVGIRLELEAIQVTQVEEYNRHGTLMADIGKQETETPEKELNQAKINMAKLELFKKRSWTPQGGGYYDCYKRIPSESDEEVIKCKEALTEYWKKKVEEAKRNPQKEGFPFQGRRYLHSGTNYRRMVEPLDIAEFSKIPGRNRNYLKHRPKHYKLLQEWQEDDERAAKNQEKLSMKNKAVTLTYDSCFWAHVEEAIILTQLLKNGKDADFGREDQSLKEDLKEFESYVMDMIKQFKVSPEIFLEKSTFMQWWREYYYYKIQEVDGHSSPLIDYMKDKKYLEYV